MIVSCIIRVVETGDWAIFNSMLDRIIGKVVDKLQIEDMALLERIRQIQGMDKKEIVINMSKALEQAKEQIGHE